MRQRTGMYTAITGIHGRSQTTPNTTHLQRHNIIPDNLQPIKARAAVRIQNPVADRHLPVRCPALPATGPGAAPVRVAGVAAVAVVLAAEGEVVDLAVAAEEVLAVAVVVDGVEDNFSGV